jgi:hypothetical protein
MSQNDFNLANQGFPSMRADINSALQALATNSSGSTGPSTTYAYQWWYDTTADILKVRNAANSAWIDFASFDQGAGTWGISGDLTIADKIVHSGDTNTAIRFPAADTVSIETNGAERVRITSAGKILAGAGTNWVGTVSQSGQSSIIERGSNANGEFVKFADGTMICTHAITETRTATGIVQTNWTMPASFVSVLDYVPSVHPATSRPDLVVGTTPLRASASLVEVYVNRTNTTNTTVYVQAVGRWY